MTNGIYTILLLILSNVFMTFAWYGHLRLQQSGVSTNWPLYLVIAFSWVIAFFELQYLCRCFLMVNLFIGITVPHFCA